MAYIDTSPLDDEEDLDAASVSTGSGPLAQSVSPQTATPAAPGQKPKTPGRFADLSEYLRVNAPQEFGTQLAGKVGSDIEAGQNTLGTAQEEFKSRADANTVTDSGGLADKVATDPFSVDKTEFSKIRDAKYQGPTSLTDAPDLYTQVTGSAGSAVGKANASKTEGGRFSLLDNYFGKPSYSSGQKSLDNLLVQNDPNSQQAFSQMRENANQLQSNASKAGVDLGQYGASARATTESTRAKARNSVGIDDAGNYVEGLGALGSQMGTLKSQAEARRKQAADDYQAATASLSGKTQYGQIDPEVAKKYGIEPVNAGTIEQPRFLQNPDIRFVTTPNYNLNATGTWGVDPSRYLSRVGDNEINEGSVATQDQAARLRALQGLAGIDTDLVNLNDAGKYDDEALTSFNKDNFSNATQSNVSQFRDKAQAKAREIEASPYGTPEQKKSQWDSFLSVLRKQYGVG